MFCSKSFGELSTSQTTTSSGVSGTRLLEKKNTITMHRMTDQHAHQQPPTMIVHACTYIFVRCWMSRNDSCLRSLPSNSLNRSSTHIWKVVTTSSYFLFLWRLVYRTIAFPICHTPHARTHIHTVEAGLHYKRGCIHSLGGQLTLTRQQRFGSTTASHCEPEAATTAVGCNAWKRRNAESLPTQAEALEASQPVYPWTNWARTPSSELAELRRPRRSCGHSPRTGRQAFSTAPCRSTFPTHTHNGGR